LLKLKAFRKLEKYDAAAEHLKKMPTNLVVRPNLENKT
jgi:hypothetical protein